MPLFDIAAASPPLLQQLIKQYGCLYPIAGEAAQQLPRNLFNLHCCADDADYLYPAAQFVDYCGKELAKKRNLLHQFLATYSARVERFNAAKHPSDCATVLQGWMQGKDKKAGEADETPCLEALELAAHFAFKGLVFYEQQQPIGFVLVEKFQQDLFIVRFAKGLNRYNGLYPFMFQQLAREFVLCVQWLNFEQDMGNPGFRRSKRSYQPLALLNKWRVTAAFA